MEGPHAATRQAAKNELRGAFAAIRRAAELIARNAPSGQLRSLAWAIARSSVRGERAVTRLG
jgi:hypothetical protein